MSTVSTRGPRPYQAAPAPPPLIARTPHLDRIAELADRARAGAGGALLVTGAAGTGRSALLAEAARRAAAGGTTVLWARCSADESDTPYAAARQLFESGPGPGLSPVPGRGTPVGGSGAVRPDADGPGADGPGAEGRGAAGSAAEDALWSLLRIHAAHHPVLLAVDDVHLADRPSREWLRGLARRIDRLPVLLLATERRQATLGTPPERFARGLPPGLADSLRLDPLDARTAALLVARRLGPRTPAALAADCARATGGNPLLLTALLTDLADLTDPTDLAACPCDPCDPCDPRDPCGPCGPGPGAHPGATAPNTLPDSCPRPADGAFPEAVEEWLGGGGARALTAARALARMQEHPDARTAPLPGTDRCDPAAMLAELAGTDPDRTAAWLAELTAQGLLDDPGPGHWPRFTHPLLADAVLAGHEPGHRARVHRAAAEYLHRAGAPDERIAGHLLLTPAPCPRWAADTLRAAARTAARADRPADAVTLLRRVLDEPLGDRRRGLVLTELGSLEATLGPDERVAGVRHLAEAVDLQHSDEGVFRTANTLGAVLAARGDAPAALELMEELAERFGDRDDLVHAVQAAAALIAAHDGHSWLQVVEGVRRFAARGAQRLAPPAYALLTEFDSTSGVLSAAEVAGRVQELLAAPVDPVCRPYVLVSAATLAQWADRLGEADRLVDRGLAAYRGPSLDPGYQCLLSVRAETRVMRGEYQALLEDFALTGPAPAARRRAGAAPDAGTGTGAGARAPGERTGRRERAEGPPLSWWCGGDPADDGTGTGIGIGTGTATGRDERDGRDEHDGRDGRGQRADRADSPEAARARYAGLLGQQNAHLVAQAVIALTETGRYWQAHGLARAIAADHSQDSWEWNEYLYARGLLRLATGEPAAALADLLECGRRQSERQVLSPIVTPWRSTAADCHTLLGEPGPAVALAEEELALARTWGTPRTVGRALRALAAATGGRHGLDLAAESVGLLRGAEVEVELIPALITYGRLLTEGGRRGAARRALREAASRAERLGTVRLRGVAVDALRASGARLGRGEHAGAEALTDSELRICRLAVAGHSNAEIAAMLHLALRTVETHLTNSFRKLGVRRRVELAGVLEG
ncbi:LuxR family transcriptional regulator [Kitasatospora sp. CM 4170]|uniref:LuxR family transcriptional regulator n=1 Tax=Kitasatospora aburaviensis TaxID=67265 RepID=A0ABW1EPJ6_9ACTN|nr:LuxR family transcriptional regulator [Kitasatospora sp. CM 4170]WNM45269.1 LuxR family transcriptional regulator [Kitasatospora sp. CM 4170]